MEFRLPELGEGIYEAEVSRWLVEPGAEVKPGQGLVEMLTDKATMEVPAPFTGKIQERKVEEGQKIKIGDLLLNYESAISVPESIPVIPIPVAQASPKSTSHRDGNSHAKTVKAAPAVRQMAQKLGIDLAQVAGTGPEGRVLVEDLTTFVKPAQPAKANDPKTDFGTPGQRIKLQGLRRKIAEHMVESTRTIPHYSYVDECDVTDLVRLRESLRESFQAKGARLTYLAFVIKAVALALKDVPIVNASLEDHAKEIVLHDHYHLGIAVSTPGGLMVPVLHDADQRSLLQIALDIDRLSSDARTGKLKVDAMRGGTFTITSIGNLGGLFATPIIHHPQVGILGIGKIVRRPVFDAQGAIRAADLMYLSFSFDHRVVDGAVGVAFGNAIIKRLQKPAGMLVD